MIQCPRCAVALPAGTRYCASCGARIVKQTHLPTMPASVGRNAGFSNSDEASTAEQTQLPTIPATLADYPPALVIGEASVANQRQSPAMPPQLAYGPPASSIGETGQVNQTRLPAIHAQSAYPASQPIYPAPAPPGHVAPQAPASRAVAPQRQGMSPGLIVLLSLLIVLLVLGSVFVGIGIGQAHPTATQPSARPTAAANPGRLYQQIIGQTPTIADSLLNGPLSLWTASEGPTGGCELVADGLHVHIHDQKHLFSCASGRGVFSNFAFQIEMRIAMGDGGGLVFRSDTLAKNSYSLQVSSRGIWRIFIQQQGQMVAELGEGTASAFISTAGQANSLTLIARGKQLTFYINQQMVTIVQDSAYTQGELGVLAYETTLPTNVIYTHARIWRL